MSQDSTSVGVEYQVMANTVFGVHYVHNDLRRTIEDIGALDANGDEAYVIGNPGEFLSEIEAPSRPDAARAADAEGQASVRCASNSRLARRFANRWFFSGNYTYSRLYGNYPGISSSDEIRTPTTNIDLADRAAAARQRLPPGWQREPGVGHRLSELGLATARTMCWDGLPPIGRMSSSSMARTNSRSAPRSAASSTAAAARRSAPTS